MQTQNTPQNQPSIPPMVMGQQNSLPAPIAETSTAAFAAQQRSLVEARYIMAMQRPRDWDTVRERMIKDCKRPSFADVARYHKPIGKGVEGPSIRFVEAALRNMGNVMTGTTTLFDDSEKRIVCVAVTDFETNVIYSQDVTITKTVERKQLKQGDTPISSRMNSYGQITYLLPGTDDDILNKQGALISKAVRTLGLRIIPGDIVDEAMTLVVQTQQARDKKDPDSAKRALFDSFNAIGVTTSNIKEYLGHPAEVLNPKELTDLRAIYSAIRDSETTWKAIMEAKEKSEADPENKNPQGTTEGKKPTTLKGALTGTVPPAKPIPPGLTPRTPPPQTQPAAQHNPNDDFFE